MHVGHVGGMETLELEGDFASILRGPISRLAIPGTDLLMKSP